jgi:PST family polysaccharide transporter
MTLPTANQDAAGAGEAPGAAMKDTTLSNRELGRTGARGAAWLLAAQTANFATNFIAIVVLARFLSPETFGIMAMAATVSNLIMLFRDFGFSAPVLTYRELSQGQLSGLYWANLAFGLLLTLVTVAVAPGVAWFYGQPILTVVLSVLAVGFLIATTGVVQSALLRRELRFRALAAIQIGASLVAMATGIAAAAAGWGIWSLVFMRLAQQAALGLGARIANRWRPSWYRRDPGLPALLKMAAHVSSAQVTNYLSRNADNVLIGWYWGDHWLGLYDQAYKLLVLPMQQLGQPLNSVLLPMLSRLDGQPGAYRAAYVRVLEKVTLATVPLACAMIALPETIVRIALGPRWLEAAPIVACLGIAMVYQPLSMALGSLLTSQKRSGLLASTGLVSAALTVLSFVIALPYGPVAVAASYAISGALVRVPLIYWMIGKEGPVRTRDQVRMLLPSLWCGAWLVAAYGGLAAVPALKDEPFALLAAAAAVTVPVMLATLAALPSGRATMRDSVALTRLVLARE